MVVCSVRYLQGFCSLQFLLLATDCPIALAHISRSKVQIWQIHFHFPPIFIPIQQYKTWIFQCIEVLKNLEAAAQSWSVGNLIQTFFGNFTKSIFSGVLILKQDSHTSASMQLFRKFSEQHSYRSPMNTCFLNVFLMHLSISLL